MQRADDNEAVVLERLKVYRRDTQPLVEYYRTRPTFRRSTARSAPDASRARSGGGDRRGAADGGCGGAVGDCLPVGGGAREDARGRTAGRRSADRAGRDGGAGRHDRGSRRAGREADSRDAGAMPAFKGYHGYPATICASVNDEVIHGIPSRDAGAARKATSSRSTSARRSTGTSATARSRCRSARCRRKRRRCCG